MKVCKGCSKEFEGKTKKGLINYCSDSCQSNLWNKNHRERTKESQKRCWRDKRSQKFKCCICGFDRAIDFCHLQWIKDGGTVRKDNITALCPNHHRLFDWGKLTLEERALIKSIKEL